MKLKPTLLTLLALAVSSSALAANLNHNAQPMNRAAQAPSFSQFDLNADKQVTPQEFEKARAQRIAARSDQGRLLRNISQAASFEQLDVNRDGVLTGDELTAHQHKMAAQAGRGQQHHGGQRGSNMLRGQI